MLLVSEIVKKQYNNLKRISKMIVIEYLKCYILIVIFD